MKKKKETKQSSITIDNVLLSSVGTVEDISLSNEDYISVSSVPSLSSDTLGDLYPISISSTTSVASMLSRRELGSNISTGSAASINFSHSSSSIIQSLKMNHLIQ